MLARIVLQVRHHVVDEQVALPLGVCERRGQQKADDALVLLQDVDAHVGGDVAAQDLQVELGVAPLFVQCGRGGEERLPLAPLVAPSAEPDPLAQRLARLEGHRHTTTYGTDLQTLQPVTKKLDRVDTGQQLLVRQPPCGREITQ